MPHGNPTIIRTNNEPITEMYMALFEDTLNKTGVLASLKLEDIGGVWVYANVYTIELYDVFIEAHKQANEDLCRMGVGLPVLQDMWDEASDIVNGYTQLFNNS